jgi:hypothetical protein
MKPNVIAQCILQIGPGNDPGSVVGRRIVWNRAYLGRPEEFIWEVMHHEAGHCILYRGHDEALAMVPLNNQTVLAPKSMMYPSPINMVVESGTILLGQNLNYYLTELFTLGQFGNIFDDDGSNASTDRSVILPDTIQTLVFESTINGCQIRAK